jgi:hypothetical protein
MPFVIVFVLYISSHWSDIWLLAVGAVGDRPLALANHGRPYIGRRGAVVSGYSLFLRRQIIITQIHFYMPPISTTSFGPIYSMNTAAIRADWNFATISSS